MPDDGNPTSSAKSISRTHIYRKEAMKSSLNTLSAIFSVLEPGKDVALVEINVVQDQTGMFHLAPGLDIFDYVLHRILSGSLTCEPKGVPQPVTVSKLQSLPFCKNCDETPAAMLHAVADKDLGHAARILYELQIFSNTPDPDRVEMFVKNRSGREILALANILMTHELGLRFRTEYLEHLENESYSAAINSIIEKNFASLDSYRTMLTSELSTTKMRSHLEGYEVLCNQVGKVVVILAGLQQEASAFMNDAPTRTEEGKSPNTDGLRESTDQLLMTREALTLQYLFAPEARDHSSAVFVPAWVSSAITYLNPDQVHSPVYPGLSDTEADTAIRLHTFDMSSIFSELNVCVSAAVALSMETA